MASLLGGSGNTRKPPLPSMVNSDSDDESTIPGIPMGGGGGAPGIPTYPYPPQNYAGPTAFLPPIRYSRQNNDDKPPPPPPGDPPPSKKQSYVKTREGTVDIPERPTVQAVGQVPESDLVVQELPNKNNEKENENKPKNKNTLRLVIAVRGIIFLSYFILSMILLAWVFDDSRSCFIRQSYSQRSLGSFSSDNMFTSTQVVRPPPRSRSEVKAGFAVWDKQKISDIGAFPIMIQDPMNDAAFWTLHVQSNVKNLELLLSEKLGTNLAGTIAGLLGTTISSSNDIGKSLTQYEGSPYFPIIQALFGGSVDVTTLYARIDGTYPPKNMGLFDGYNSDVEAFRPGTYLLMNDGRVLTPSLPDLGETSNLLTSLRAQSMHGRNIGGLLPNIGRCVKPIDESKGEPEVQRWIRDVADIVTSSHLKGSCILTGQMAMVDVSSNYKTSAVPFSSTNVVYMTLIVIWVTSSFALFYLRSTDLLNSGERWKNTMMLINLVLIIWHLIIAVLIFTPAMSSRKNVPLNNVLISTVLVAATVSCQYRHVSKSKKDEKNETPVQLNPTPVDDVFKNAPRLQPLAPPNLNFSGNGSVNFDRDPQNNNGGFVPTTTPNSQSTSRSYPSFSMGISNPRIRYVALNQHQDQRMYFMGANNNIDMAMKTMKAFHVHSISSIESENTLRIMEQAITTPLLTASVLAAMSPTASTSAISLVYLSSLLFYLICIAGSKLKRMIKSILDYDEEGEKLYNEIWIASVFLTTLMIISSANSLYIFMSYALAHAKGFSPDGATSGAVWILILCQLFFTIVFCRETLAVSLPKKNDSNKEKFIYKFRRLLLSGESGWKSIAIYSFLNWMTKFIVPVLIMGAANTNKFPQQSCNMWADTQGSFSS